MKSSEQNPTSLTGLTCPTCLWLALLLTGCALGPNYKRPALVMPGEFRGPPISAATNSVGDLPWWEIFKDDTLHELIRAALTNNYDLRIAITRVEQSRAILMENRALFFPQLDYRGTVARGKNAVNGFTAFNGGETTDVYLLSG